MGGDEFTVLLTDLHSKEAAMEKAAQLLDELSSNESVSTLCMAMPSCSVGVAVYPEDGQDANTLLRHADVKSNLGSTRSEILSTRYFWA